MLRHLHDITSNQNVLRVLSGVDSQGAMHFSNFSRTSTEEKVGERTGSTGGSALGVGLTAEIALYSPRRQNAEGPWQRMQRRPQFWAWKSQQPGSALPNDM